MSGGEKKEPTGAPAAATGPLAKVGQWVEHRLGIGEGLRPIMDHAVPDNTASFWYVFGSGTMVAFILQLITGVCLALVYAPSTEGAYESLEYLNYVQPLGWFLRALHYWGSNFMVAIMTVHMIQVFLFGAFKYPRELTWVVGVVLFVLTLAMAFSGQVMRFDQDAYWGLSITASIAGRAPVIGPEVVAVLLGGPIIGAEALTRFFALHVFVIPGLLIVMLVLHLVMVIRLGVNEWPMPGRLVKKETYENWYHELAHGSKSRLWPHVAAKDAVFGGIVMIAIVLCSAILGPKGPHGVPDPTLIDTAPKPDFFFLPLFSAFALLPESWEDFLILGLPPLGIALLLAVPFMLRSGEKSWKRRPVSVLFAVLSMTILIVLGVSGEVSPWSPRMNAWSGAPVPQEFLRGRTPLELRGAVVFQGKQCRNCHALGEEGGLRGPPLDDVSVRMTEHQLTQQVIQGGGNMPAYAKQLSPAETTALVRFLMTLRPDYQLPARTADDPLEARAN